MKVSIHDELEKGLKKEKIQNNIDPVNQIKLLLESDSTEDARILRGLSKNSQFNRIEKIRSEQLELEKLENDYEGKVYKIEQIKKLCIDYRLRFLQSSLFTGSYDVEVASKIKEFAKSTNSPIDEWTLGRRYYVMAPSSMFELKDEKYITKAEIRRQEDPAIFFQIDDEHYRLIHKWGNDFTILRLIEGFRWKSWWNHQWFNTFMLLPIVGVLVMLLSDSPAAQFENYLILTFFFIGLISFIFSHFIFGIKKQDEGTAIKGFFSKTNWNSESKLRR